MPLRRGLEQGEGDPATNKFSHTLLVSLDTDIRDAYNVGAIWRHGRHDLRSG